MIPCTMIPRAMTYVNRVKRKVLIRIKSFFLMCRRIAMGPRPAKVLDGGKRQHIGQQLQYFLFTYLFLYDWSKPKSIWDSNKTRVFFITLFLFIFSLCFRFSEHHYCHVKSANWNYKTIIHRRNVIVNLQKCL